MNKKITIITLLSLLIIVLSLILLKGISIFKSFAADPIAANFTEEERQIGLNAKVNESIIITRKTGTGPFDTEEGAGNDTSADNDIVRSFDQITWTIEKLNAGETASFKYKLKLKEKYDEKILNVIMPTNKKVDVTYTGTDNTEHKETSDVSPKIVLKKEKKQEVPEEDPTVAPDPIPQTGEKIIFIAAAIIVIFATAVVNLIKTRKIK